MWVYHERYKWKKHRFNFISNKNVHIDCDKDAHDIHQLSIVKPLNDGLKDILDMDKPLNFQ